MGNQDRGILEQAANIERAPTTLVSVTKNHLDEVEHVTIVQNEAAQPVVTTHSKKKL